MTDTLAKNRTSTHGSEIYMGVCQLDPKLPHRRIDIKCFPKEQFGCAVLYFTGSDFFNRSMRYFAKKKGFLLAEHGLYEAHRSGGTIAVEEQVTWTGNKIPCYKEEDVFRILKLDYKKPEERSVGES